MPNPVYSSPLLGVLTTLGNLAIWLGLGSAILCAVFYWWAMLRSVRAASGPVLEPSSRGAWKNGRLGGDGAISATELRTERIANWARRYFYVMSGCVILGAFCLMTLILRQEYVVAYIHKNSNASLPFGFRFASFWSDQDGTFFLWGIYNTIYASVLLWKARQDERWVMPFFVLVNVSLFTLLTFMNPFWLVSPETVRSQEGLPAEILAALPANAWEHVQYYLGWGRYIRVQDGNGLNEQLQNFWMVIHPPTLFFGYACMMMPACFAAGALMKRDYDNWVNRAAPWLAFGWTILGFGIFLGAYWAYETLNWGGYWSWDPVENASIVPWVVGTTMIHGFLAQRNRGNYKQSNLFLGIMLGTTVLLGSFLVRSGVLGTTSVHAFASPQKSVFYTLMGALLLWFIGTTGIWLWRYKDIQAEIAYEHVWERHFGFFLGMIVLSATAIVIMFGVFFVPVILPLLISKKFNIDYTFYNKALLPVMYVTVLLMALTPLMPWKRGREDRPLGAFNSTILALCGIFTLFFMFAAAYAWMGGFTRQNDPAYVAMGLILGLAVVSNGVKLIRARHGGWLATGPWLAHLGFVVMLAGVVATSRFNTNTPVTGLGVGESYNWKGRTFTYMGMTEPTNKFDRPRMQVRMKNGNETFDFLPKFFVSRQTGDPMGWPHIRSEWFDPSILGDLYLSPGGLQRKPLMIFEGLKPGDAKAEVLKEDHEPHEGHEDHALPKGVAGTKVLISFQDLDLDSFRKSLQSGDPANAIVYANATLTINGQSKQIRPGGYVKFGENGPEIDPIPFPVEGLGDGVKLYLFGSVIPGRVSASFALATEVAQFQILHVPAIHVLWFGCLMMFTGAFFCYLRRAQLARRGVPVKTTA